MLSVKNADKVLLHDDNAPAGTFIVVYVTSVYDYTVNSRANSHVILISFVCSQLYRICSLCRISRI